MSKPRRSRGGTVRRRTLIATALALIAPALALASASPALAAPKGIFAKYSDCPTEVPGVAICTFGQTTSGEFAIGKTKVPINKTITLQGGGIPTGGVNSNEYFLYPAKDGNSLSKTELNVPGGLLGLVNCTEIKGEGFFEKIERAACKAIFENKTTGVTATTELVATATNPAILDLAALVEGSGTAITLPVRVHLKNPLLGEGCYVGSAAHPIQLHLTTGTTAPPPPNKPITGKLGTPKTEIEKGYESTVIKENTLVDNAFSAPVSEGCGGLFSFLIGPIINSKIGLPSAAGHNTAILSGTLNTAETEAVLASEKF
jgi:phage baseplate assembly protein gpV